MTGEQRPMPPQQRRRRHRNNVAGATAATSPAPPQQRRRRHDPMREQFSGQQPGPGREEHPVSRRQPRPADLSAQHRRLVSQDQQLDVLGRLTSTTKDNQRKRSTSQQVHQRKDHKAVFQPTI
jgi:hypothetical protein